MPITFEQAAPMAPEITAGGGRAETFSKDLPSLVSLYNNIASNRQSGANAAAAAAAHVQSSRIAAAVQGDAITQRANEAALGRQSSLELAAMQGAEQRDLVQLHGQVQSQQLSQREQMHYDQMRNALADVMMDPTLTDEEKHAVGMKLKTGIDIYGERQRNAQAAHLEMQDEAIKQANAKQAAMANMDATAFAQHVQDHTATLEDGTRIYTDPFNKTHVIPPQKEPVDKAPKPFNGAQAEKNAMAEARMAYPAEAAKMDANEPTSQEFRNYAADVWRREKANYDAAQKPVPQQAPPGMGNESGTANPTGAAQDPYKPELERSATPPVPGSMIAQRPQLNTMLDEAWDRAAKTPAEGNPSDIRAVSAIAQTRGFMKAYPNFQAIPAPRQPEFQQAIIRSAKYLSPSLAKMLGVKE